MILEIDCKAGLHLFPLTFFNATPSRKPVPQKSQYYAELLLKGSPAPAVIAYWDKDLLRLTDGQHRLESHRIASKNQILVYVAEDYHKAMQLARRFHSEQTHGNRSQ